MRNFSFSLLETGDICDTSGHQADEHHIAKLRVRLEETLAKPLFHGLELFPR
jgi:hypothetical protein